MFKKIFNTLGIGKKGSSAPVNKKNDNTIEGEIIKDLGHHLSLDTDFYFCTLRLDDGKEMDVVLGDGNPKPVGQRIRASVYMGVFNIPLLDNIEELPKKTPPAPRSFNPFKRS